MTIFADHKKEIKQLLNELSSCENVRAWFKGEKNFNADVYWEESDSYEDWLKATTESKSHKIFFSKEIIDSNYYAKFSSLIEQCQDIKLDGKHLNTGSGSFLITNDDLIKWMIEESIKTSSSNAIKATEVFLRSDRLESYQISIFLGVEAKEIIKIDNKTSIMPYSMVPESTLSRCFPPQKESHLFLRRAMIVHPVPAIAIVTKRSFEKFYRDEVSSEASEYTKIHDEHQILGQLMTLLENGPSISLASAITYNKKMPMEIQNLSFSTDLRCFSSDHPLYKSTLLDSYTKEIKLLYKKFISLSPIEKDRLSIPLEFFVKAVAFSVGEHARRANQIIDISIAFESLLKTANEKDELAHRIALRSALLMEQGIDERKVIYDLSKRLYNYRSDVVHTGQFSKKAPHEKISADLEGGFSLCSSIIKKFISMGKVPEWRDFDLRGGLA